MARIQLDWTSAPRKNHPNRTSSLRMSVFPSLVSRPTLCSENIVIWLPSERRKFCVCIGNATLHAHPFSKFKPTHPQRESLTTGGSSVHSASHQKLPRPDIVGRQDEKGRGARVWVGDWMTIQQNHWTTNVQCSWNYKGWPWGRMTYTFPRSVPPLSPCLFYIHWRIPCTTPTAFYEEAE